MNKALQIILTAAAALLLFLLGVFSQRETRRPAPVPLPDVKPDTVYIHDTTKILDPVPIFQTIERTEIEYIAESEIIIKEDSLVVPIQTRIYQTDEYRAVIQGYKAKLTELDIYGTSMRISQPVVYDRTPWGLGIAAGVAVTRDGWAPAITLGITYNFYQPIRRR